MCACVCVQWLGKNSTAGRLRRLVQELVVHTAQSVDQSFTPLRLDYVPFLRQALLHPLQSGGDGVDQVLLT